MGRCLNQCIVCCCRWWYNSDAATQRPSSQHLAWGGAEIGAATWVTKHQPNVSLILQRTPLLYWALTMVLKTALEYTENSMSFDSNSQSPVLFLCLLPLLFWSRLFSTGPVSLLFTSPFFLLFSRKFFNIFHYKIGFLVWLLFIVGWCYVRHAAIGTIFAIMG